MAIRFVLGRAGSGKTHLCVTEILRALADPQQTARLLLLTPEQSTFQMEQLLAQGSPRGGYWRAEVLSFTRLVTRIEAERPPPRRVISDLARQLGLRLAALRQAEALPALRRLLDRSGFLEGLDRLVTRLLQERTTPQALASAVQRGDARLRQRLEPLVLLYEEYARWLGTAGIDPDQRIDHAAQQLAATDWLRGAEVWVDGFSHFTQQQLELLMQLASIARQVSVTLLLDPQQLPPADGLAFADAGGLFAATEQTMRRLTALARSSGVALLAPVMLPTGHAQPRRFRCAPLAELERRFDAPAKAAAAAPRGAPATAAPLRVLVCRTQREEIELAAGWFRRAVHRSGGALRYRDMALVFRDLEPFVPLVVDAFETHEVPYFLDRRTSMREHALARAVDALFDALQDDLAPAPLCRLIESGVTFLRRSAQERLAAAVRILAPTGLAAWMRPVWTPQRLAPRFSWGEVDDAERLKLAGVLRELLRIADAPSRGEVWARALHGALRALGVRWRIRQWISEAQQAGDLQTAEQHRLVWERLTAILQELHDVLGESLLSAAEVGAVVSGGLASGVMAIPPPTIDQVLIGSIDRSRHPNVRMVWLAGFNEGVFPQPPQHDALLSDDDRAALEALGVSVFSTRGQELADEQLLGYVAMTRASEALVISYAREDAAGDPLFPSPLLAQAGSALPAARSPDEEDSAPACLPRLAEQWLDAAASADGALLGRYSGLMQALRTHEAAGSQLERLLRGQRYRNAAEPVVAYVQQPPDAAWRCSPKELRAYQQCPFQHFALFGLRLQEPHGPPPLPRLLGQMAHVVIADVFRRVQSGAAPIALVTDEAWRSALQAALKAWFEAQGEPEMEAPRTARDAALARQAELLDEVVRVHAQRYRAGRFEPQHVELQMGEPDSASPALAPWHVALADGRRVSVHGALDRLDGCRTDNGELVLVYDYKSRADVGSWKLTPTRDRLQLLAYLAGVLAARGLPVAAGGVLVAPLRPGSAGSNPPPDALQRLMWQYMPRGALAEVLSPALDAGQPRRSNVARLGGSGNARRDTRPAAELAQLLDAVEGVVRSAADGALRGQISIAPLVEQRTLACTRCAFAPVCRFERSFNRPRGVAPLEQRVEVRMLRLVRDDSAEHA